MNKKEALAAMLAGKKVRTRLSAKKCYFYYNEREHAFKYSSFSKKDYPIDQMLGDHTGYEIYTSEPKKITVTRDQLRDALLSETFLSAALDKLFKE